MSDSLVTPSVYIEQARRSLEEIQDAYESSASLDVPDCPGWTIRDLCGHIGSVAAMVTTVLETDSEQFTPAPDNIRNPPESESEFRTWFYERTQHLIEVLSTTAPERATWTWGPPPTARFYLRRMAMEMTIHSADCQRARGRPWSVPDSISVDGIDEFVDVVLPRAITRSSAPVPTDDLHLHCPGGEWVLHMVDGRLVVTREHAKSAIAWRGPAPSLFLWVWGRRTGDIEVFGNIESSDQWSRLVP